MSLESVLTSHGCIPSRPQSLIVWSSLALAKRYGSVGLQVTAFTTWVWPPADPVPILATISPLSLLQMLTLASSLPQSTKDSFAPPKAHLRTNILCSWPPLYLLISSARFYPGPYEGPRSKSSSLGCLRETFAKRYLPSLLSAMLVIASLISTS